MAVFQPDPKRLLRQLNSIIAQTEQSWECLVGIDGSDHSAMDLVTSYVRGDQRFHILEFEENVGVYRHFERLLSHVSDTSTWVALCDQDDYWYPEKLHHLSNALGMPGVTAATSRARVVTEGSTTTALTDRKPGDSLSILLLNQMTGSHAILARDVVRHALPFPPDVLGAIHDHWLAVCAATMGRIAFMDEVLQDYVQHDSNLIGETRLRSSLQVATQLTHHEGTLEEIVDRSWIWRQVMATARLSRFPSAPRQSEYRAIASGHLGARLVFSLIKEAVLRRIPFRVALAAFVGAARCRLALKDPQ